MKDRATRQAKFAELAERARGGVRVVSAPELFPTPVDVARHLCALAHVGPGDRVLEPSAGTGRLVSAIREAGSRVAGTPVGDPSSFVGVEINAELAAAGGFLRGDFLEMVPSDLGGLFDRVVMNPPFSADVAHVLHALGMLKRGGRLAALVGGGPRQEKALRAHRATVSWERLPAGSFASEGTGANVVALVMVRL